MSASWGYTLGREALKGITQPDVRPTNNLAGSKGNGNRREELAILKEKDILKIVKARIEGRDEKAKDNSDASKSANKPVEKKKPPEQAAKPATKFPMTAKDSGVTMEVSSARQRGSSLLLDVSMKNEGSQSVRFLYSFLNVTDDQGRALSASAEDLPGELPPTGETFYGTVSIPTALLDNAKTLSLALTDYPNQKLQLKVSGIPVAN